MAKKKETAKRTATELPDDLHRTKKKKKKKNDDEVYIEEDIVDFRTKGKQKEWLVKCAWTAWLRSSKRCRTEDKAERTTRQMRDICVNLATRQS